MPRFSSSAFNVPKTRPLSLSNAKIFTFGKTLSSNAFRIRSFFKTSYCTIIDFPYINGTGILKRSGKISQFSQQNA
jgi:hypothetical protein